MVNPWMFGVCVVKVTANPTPHMVFEYAGCRAGLVSASWRGPTRLQAAGLGRQGERISAGTNTGDGRAKYGAGRTAASAASRLTRRSNQFLVDALFVVRSEKISFGAK